jgi:hypothetical protein
MKIVLRCGVAAFLFLALTSSVLLRAAPAEIVLGAAHATDLHGDWARAADATAANGQLIASADRGWSSPNSPIAAPANYVEFTFTAVANTPYRVWLRLRAPNGSKYNDSVFVQFSEATDVNGVPRYRIGGTDGMFVNLQSCSGCPMTGWGWVDGAYWLSQVTTLKFPTTGSHVVRVQTREDGVQLDQIVLSPERYLTAPPGPMTGDTTFAAGPAHVPSVAMIGQANLLPGTIQAVNFDDGGAGVAYHDTTAGNSGGVYRPTGVDIEPLSDGMYGVGWIAAGEWLNYTVDVATAGEYILEARVASPGQGGKFHIDFANRNAAAILTVPNTGSWRTWVSVTSDVTLDAGRQTMKVIFDSEATTVGNLAWLRVTRKAAIPPPVVGTRFKVPGTIQPEAYDTDGAGHAYSDTTPGNYGGAVRSDDVDIQASAAYGFNVGWVADGEWLDYAVHVAAAGDYVMDFAVSSPFEAGRLRALVGGSVTGVIAIPNSGGWQNWNTVSAPITLAAGDQTLRVAFDVGGFNLGEIGLRAVARSRTTLLNAGGDLQAALDAAEGGDTILLQPGAVFVGNFVLPRKPLGSRYITIASAGDDRTLPGENVRITPAHAPLLAKLRSPNATAVLLTAPGAHHYRLQWLEFLGPVNGGGEILSLGDGSSAQNTLDLVPHDLIVDRVYLHANVTVSQKRGIGLNSAATSIVNSYISEIKAIGQDSQAIGGWNGPGPYLISNNYLEAAGENIMFGGADPSIPNLVPSDITFTRNHLSKPWSWRGGPWEVKNLFELKNAQRVVVDGNLMENNWLAAQTGYAILLKSVNQDGGCPWCVVQDVTFTNNHVRHTASALNILGYDPRYTAIPANNLTFRNNLFEDVSRIRYGGQGWFLQINGTANVTIDHNTVINDGSSTIMAYGDPSTGFVLTNNVLLDNLWGIKGDNTGVGRSALAMYFPGVQMFGNILVTASPGLYPAGNFYPPTIEAVGFVDFAGGNLALAVTSIYAKGGVDGTNPGCDFPALAAALGRAIQ